VSRRHDINGRYTLATGDHDGDGSDDLAILAPPGGTDWVWFGAGAGFTKVARQW
jgi:hypothetical protein